MKINPNYGDRIITVPAVPVLKYLPQASESELKVLIFVMSNCNSTFEEIENGTGLNKACITDALFKWKELGVLTCVGLKRTKSNSDNTTKDDLLEKTDTSNFNTKPNKYLVSQSPSHYSSDEINDFLEEDTKNKELIDICQNILGRTLYVTDSSTIVSLVKYYKLENDYIMLIIQHLVDTYGNDVSMRRIEKEVASVYDRDITTYKQLEEFYKAEAKARSLEERFKALIGVGERKLTSKQKGLLEKWVGWGYDYDIIEFAYEITADRADRFSIGYMDAVITNWHDEGCKTLDDAKSASEKFDETKIRQLQKKKKKKSEPEGGSFDTYDFWSTALENSYRD